MPDWRGEVESAFQKLALREGYVERVEQTQLSMLLYDLIGQGTPAALEAPTGVGKSLATLIPSLAHAAQGKKVVVATYTNVLADQYWQKDLPLAKELIPAASQVDSCLLMGRARYICQVALNDPDAKREFPLRDRLDLGVESEVRVALSSLGIRGQKATNAWRVLGAPAACPARACPEYSNCFYYQARKKALKSGIIITNHAVVIQDALMKGSGESDDEQESAGLLGPYDYLIIDEAHDFPTAAANGLEFELTSATLDQAENFASRIQNSMRSLAPNSKSGPLHEPLQLLKDRLSKLKKRLFEWGDRLPGGVIIDVNPIEWREDPGVKSTLNPGLESESKTVAKSAHLALDEFLKAVEVEFKELAERGAFVEPIRASVRNYVLFLSSMREGCRALNSALPGAVSSLNSKRAGPDSVAFLRHDLVDLRKALTDLIWDQVPATCLSATLALDGGFEAYRETTGFRPAFEEILPSPFDFATQAALYMPADGAIPDPSMARRNNAEQSYYQAIAKEISSLITVAQGRTLALFHSRKEMLGVKAFIDVADNLPILVQGTSGLAALGDAFKSNRSSSLFALRSFWTGFDAPGDTLSCLIIVRVPFEVPTEPANIAKAAMLIQEGKNPFMVQAMPAAKMMIRQGAGRLIRRSSDSGLIALLDPRLITKRYGPEILENLPEGMRVFRSIQAVADSGLLEEKDGI